ncbi:phosphate ABC transporter permease protein [Phenylobacterium zucineum HLK1]|uniref:Phosphate transport system permease protein n=1 Tax=Phenylobacterium zucineum (strain HLK1) TaxID=450851 RepID=B4REH5_PHEZH|nr:phosphate ABC transporter permease subunit PstC [Phenylobacterium zucineum]ACG76917.1 phosphate ABC transporter permease protein [Phenylobacterium zucineum HLK1]
MITWAVLAALVLFSAVTYVLGRRKLTAQAAGQGPGARAHSRPGYHGAYVMLWVAAPAAAVLLLHAAFGPRVSAAMVEAEAPAAVQALEPQARAVFFHDALAIGRGYAPSETLYAPDVREALEAEAREAARTDMTLRGAAVGLALILAVGGFLFAYRRVRPEFRARERVEGWTSALLVACSVAAVLTTVGIVASLAFESVRFFQAVPPLQFLFGTEWDPQIAMRSDQYATSGAFGAVPLFVGTFLIMIIAMTVAAPIGLLSAIYLAEYASRPTRAIVKPMLEILAGVPTVVYGFFAALTVGPLFRGFFNGLGAQLVGGPLHDLGVYLTQVQNQMALVAGAVMGIMLIPFVSSLSDDIINAVPQSLRDGSLAMGATPSETIKKVVMPAALPGIMGALLLAVSRAIGETMIVTMAAGLQARMTLNPLDTVTTVTVQIVTLLTGDQEFDSPKTLSAFGLGLTLFVITLILNVIALRIVQRYREQYD